MASPRSGPKSPRSLGGGPAVPAVVLADGHVGVGVDVGAAVGGAHHQLAHVAQAGVVPGPPRLVAGSADALRRAIGEHLEARVAGQQRHPREAVTGEREDPTAAHQLRRREHLIGRRHRGQALQRGAEQRRADLARRGEVGRDALERVPELALGSLARGAAGLDPAATRPTIVSRKDSESAACTRSASGQPPSSCTRTSASTSSASSRARRARAATRPRCRRSVLVPAVVVGIVPGDARSPSPRPGRDRRARRRG